MKHEAKEVDYKLLKITSNAFADGGLIPAKYTCDGVNVSPPLDIEHIPEAAKSLAIIADDPDAPDGTWVHWLVWNIPLTHHIKENQVHGVQGVNDFNKRIYGGPCPRPGKEHRYFFKVYALDTLLELPENTKKYLLERSMSNHILAFGKLTGVYSRQNY